MDALANYQRLVRDIVALESAEALLSYDQQTAMPKNGIEARSEVAGKLATLVFDAMTSNELADAIDALEAQSGLAPEVEASLRRVSKEHRRMRSIPAEVYKAFATDRARGQAAWEEARAEDDFGAFQPYLERMVGYAKQFADCYGYEEAPYDALLEIYESGMTSRQLDGIIQPLREQLVPFIRELIEQGQAPDRAALSGEFPIEAQRELSLLALRQIGYDFDSGRLDEAVHPFTSGIGAGDVRLTTRFRETDLFSGLFGTLHEGGHALYEQGVPTTMHPLRLSGGSSFGIHESQSRMYENQLGRSLSFWRHFHPELSNAFPQFKAVDTEALYRAINTVTPSFIRVEADEVTYNLHIMLRYELETELMTDKLAVKDLPERWNTAMENYLGVRPASNRDGVLQDVHWSVGYFGYFPTYMLGNLYCAQLFATLRKALPNLDEQITSGQFAPLLEWLRSNVHQQGAAVEPVELIQQVTGEAPNSQYFVDYVRTKYADIYQL